MSTKVGEGPGAAGNIGASGNTGASGNAEAKGHMTNAHTLTHSPAPAGHETPATEKNGQNKSLKQVATLTPRVFTSMRELKPSEENSTGRARSKTFTPIKHQESETSGRPRSATVPSPRTETGDNPEEINKEAALSGQPARTKSVGTAEILKKIGNFVNEKLLGKEKTEELKISEPTGGRLGAEWEELTKSREKSKDKILTDLGEIRQSIDARKNKINKLQQEREVAEKNVDEANKEMNELWSNGPGPIFYSSEAKVVEACGARDKIDRKIKAERKSLKDELKSCADKFKESSGQMENSAISMQKFGLNHVKIDELLMSNTKEMSALAQDSLHLESRILENEGRIVYFEQRAADWKKGFANLSAEDKIRVDESITGWEKSAKSLREVNDPLRKEIGNLEAKFKELDREIRELPKSDAELPKSEAVLPSKNEKTKRGLLEESKELCKKIEDREEKMTQVVKTPQQNRFGTPEYKQFEAQEELLKAQSVADRVKLQELETQYLSLLKEEVV